ncbi:tyrosine-type recombinase/integrase [Sinorhizobium meliloti]|uniref:tyrosine-type recombinase/integrase n=1 Tax=Rhizobium meliloti TaxID=382 RepID=UPI003D65E580
MPAAIVISICVKGADMPLVLVKRSDTPNWYLRGSVRGLHVYESTKTSDDAAAETIRILREKQLLDESIFGKKINVTFEQAAKAYIDGGGSKRFLPRILAALGSRPLRKIKQNDLDSLARKLHPDAAPETLNRQCYTPFIAIWNHAVTNEWADLRKWQRPRRVRGTATRKDLSRSGSQPVDYDRASLFVSHMSPAPAMAMTALFYTGLRPIELFTLEQSDVSVDKRWIVVRSSKTGEPRGVPMHEFLVPLFASLLKRRDALSHVFRSFRGQPYKLAAESGGQLSSSMEGTRRRLAKQGIVILDISPYTARHTVSTQLVINGVHPHIKDQIMGHAVDSMSRRYTNVPQASLIEAINTLPVPQTWRSIRWWGDPLACSRNHVKWGARSYEHE